MSTPTTHPRQRHASNEQNEHIQKNLSAAHRAVSQIVQDGFTVLRVEVEGAEPVIWIQVHPRCSRLHGHRFKIEGGAECLYTWRAALETGRDRCWVQWKSKEAG